MSDETNDSPADVQRGLAVVGGLALVSSFVLPFADIVDPDVIGAGTSTLRGYEAGSVPLVLFGIGVLVLAVTSVRWQLATQVTVGVCGVIATLASLIARAWLASENAGLRVGVYEGPAPAFEPGLGTIVALFGSVLVIAGGFGAVLDHAVTVLRSEE